VTKIKTKKAVEQNDTLEGQSVIWSVGEKTLWRKDFVKQPSHMPGKTDWRSERRREWWQRVRLFAN